MSAVGLTDAEHEAMRCAGALMNACAAMVPPGPARDSDLDEIVALIHSIQGRIMMGAAARAHPDLYRPLGGWPAGTVRQAVPSRSADRGGLAFVPPLRTIGDGVGSRAVTDAELGAADAGREAREAPVTGPLATAGSEGDGSVGTSGGEWEASEDSGG